MSILPKFFILLAFLMLPACTHQVDPMGKPLPELTYDHLTPYKPYGGAVEIRQSATITPETRKAMQRLVIAPDELITRYARNRFATKEKNSHLPVRSIFDINVLNFSEKSDEENIIGILSGAAADYYTLELAIHIYPVQVSGSLLDPYTINLTRELLIPDNVSLSQREFRQFEFLEKVITDIDGVISKFIYHMQ